eukprot:15927450-Heterocapsa_arctica.AAC.1
MSAELTQAQEEAAAAEAKKTRESVGKSRTPDPESVHRRAQRIPIQGQGRHGGGGGSCAGTGA